MKTINTINEHIKSNKTRVASLVVLMERHTSPKRFINADGTVSLCNNVYSQRESDAEYR